MIDSPTSHDQLTDGSPKYSKVVVLGGLSSFQMLAMFRRGLFYTFLSIYMLEFLGMSVFDTTLYATVPMVLSSIGQMFIWGRISDKLQKRRTLIIIGEFIAGSLLILTYIIHRQIVDTKYPNYNTAGYVIIGGLSIIEIFWSMSNIGWSALISDLYPSNERSRVMSLLTGIGGVGRVIGIALGGALYEGFFQFNYEGWGFFEGSLFYLASIAMFLSTIPLFFIPEGGIKSKKISLEKSVLENVIDIDDKSNLNLKSTIDNSKIYRHNLKIFIFFLIALVFINFGRNSVAVIYSQYIRLDQLLPVKVDAGLLSYIANMRSVATIIVGIVAVLIIKKIGNGNTMIIGTIIAILYLLCTVLASTLFPIFVGGFLSGTSEVIIGAAAYAYAADLIPEEKRGKIFGIYNATFFLSWGLASTLITGPLVDGLIASGKSKIDSYKMGFIVAMILTTIGMGLLIGLEIYRRKYNKHEEKNKNSDQLLV